MNWIRSENEHIKIVEINTFCCQIINLYSISFKKDKGFEYDVNLTKKLQFRREQKS